MSRHGITNTTQVLLIKSNNLLKFKNMNNEPNNTQYLKEGRFHCHESQALGLVPWEQGGPFTGIILVSAWVACLYPFFWHTVSARTRQGMGVRPREANAAISHFLASGGIPHPPPSIGGETIVFPISTAIATHRITSPHISISLSAQFHTRTASRRPVWRPDASAIDHSKGWLGFAIPALIPRVLEPSGNVWGVERVKKIKKEANGTCLSMRYRN